MPVVRDGSPQCALRWECESNPSYRANLRTFESVASSSFQRGAPHSSLSAEGSLGMGSAFGDSQQAMQSTNEGLDGLRIGSSQVTSPDRNAFEGVLAAFRRYNIVALDEPHGDHVASEFRIELVHQPGFADKVSDIVFECGNSRYQKVLDRYISGGNRLMRRSRPYGETRRRLGSATLP
jgi:hypothetical protein